MPKKKFEGQVIRVSHKTAVVLVKRIFTHPIYKKVLRTSKKYLVHDDLGVAVGDGVGIVESPPRSKRKKFVIETVTTRGNK